MSTVTHTTAVAVFDDRASADAAIDELRSIGFGPNQIGVVTRDVQNKNVAATMQDADSETAAGSGALAGAITGAGIGGLVGLGVLAGVVPVIGPALAAGTLATILSNVAVGAGVVGLAGALLGAGLPEDEAKYYESQLEGNRTVVTVLTNGRFEEAHRVLASHGGYTYSDRVAR